MDARDALEVAAVTRCRALAAVTARAPALSETSAAVERRECIPSADDLIETQQVQVSALATVLCVAPTLRFTSIAVERHEGMSCAVDTCAAGQNDA